jgi:riboflavin kinase/FMN adenylyltransferase
MPPSQPSPGAPQLAVPTVTSIVQVGDKRGRLLGFPTANLYPNDVESWPGGVYASRALTQDGAWWPAATNVGTRPTFTDGRVTPSIEVHLIGFDGDLYGQPLTVVFLERLRGEVRFGSVTELVAQLRRDIDEARAVVGRSGC